MYGFGIAYKIFRRDGTKSFLSAFSRCEKTMQLNTTYDNDKGFYVWTRKEDALKVLEWLKTERAKTIEEIFGYPAKDLVLTEVAIQGVKKEYTEYGGIWEEGLPAMQVNRMIITQEIK